MYLALSSTSFRYTSRHAQIRPVTIRFYFNLVFFCCKESESFIPYTNRLACSSLHLFCFALKFPQFLLL